MRRVVVVGASLAGVHAAEALREAGFTGEVTLLGAEPHRPYDRPPLSKAALRDGTPATPLRPDSWYAEHDVTLRLGVPADKLDLAGRRVRLADGAVVPFDGLIIATGSMPRRLPTDRAQACVLRTADDSARLHAALRKARRVAVVGAGFIGLEVAATARSAGLEVTVLERAPAPLSRVLGDEVGRWVAAHHETHGVEVRCGVGVDRVEAAGGGSRLVLSDGDHVTADVVVAGVGAKPAVEWLRGSGLVLVDGVVCDAHLRTSAPGVVAAGDVARWYNPLFDEDLRVEQWTNAVEQGRYAARSLLGAVDGPYAGVPYFWSDQFEAKLRFVGTATAAEEVRVVRADASALVALFGRDGVLRGALCVNAPRELVRYRQAIADRVPWRDVAYC